MELSGGKKRKLALKSEDHFIDSRKKEKKMERPGYNLEDFIPGHHEVETCSGGEGDLLTKSKECMKNPGHKSFIPVNDLKLDHLPIRNRTTNMLRVIKSICALTVLINVKYTSRKRPKSTPCFSGQYPFYNIRGSDIMRIGTGRVWRVDKYTESDNNGTCPCGRCLGSDTPSEVWGVFHVVTALHVVFNDKELQQTSCVVGFDDNKHPGVRVDGWKLLEADIEMDWCKFVCVSCDLQLVDELHKMCRRFDKLRRKEVCDGNRLAVIVTHPHGLAKQVSIERWKQKFERKMKFQNCDIDHMFDEYIDDDDLSEDDNDDDDDDSTAFFYSKFRYTTCTCPGSSGAFVYMPGNSWYWCQHTHSGSISKLNYNYSGGCTDAHFLPTM